MSAHSASAGAYKRSRRLGAASKVRSHSRASARVITVIAAFSITIVRLPLFVEHKSILDPLILGTFALCIGWGASRQPRGSFTNYRALWILLYAVIVVVALFRGAELHAYGSLESVVNQGTIYILFAAFGIVLITSAHGRRERNERLLAIAFAPAIYVAINTLMHLAGLQSPEAGGLISSSPAELLGYLGIVSDRTKFPLASSVNLYSIVVAAALASMVVVRVRAPRLISRKIAWLVGVACIYCLLLGDSRGALAIAIVAVLLLIVRPRLSAYVVAGVIPLLPLIVLGGTSLISGTGLNHDLSRSGNQFDEVATASGRTFIWEGSWEVLRHLSVQELYGWGAAGHVTSGASAHYAYVFPGNTSAETIFTHDVDLQMIFDTGYVGLAIYIFAVGITWRRIQNYLRDDPKSPAIAFLPILLVIILSGATEVSPTYYSQEALLTTLLIMGASSALPLPPKSDKKRVTTIQAPTPKVASAQLRSDPVKLAR